jgi:hypothetical protein
MHCSAKEDSHLTKIEEEGLEERRWLKERGEQDVVNEG